MDIVAQAECQKAPECPAEAGVENRSRKEMTMRMKTARILMCMTGVNLLAGVCSAQWSSWDRPVTQGQFYQYNQQQQQQQQFHEWGRRMEQQRQQNWQRSIQWNQSFLFRGATGESVLFGDKAFSGLFMELDWIDAAETRDVRAMAAAAWALKGVETALGKVDTRTSSSLLFKTAAEVAVEQGNAEALAEIIKLSPDCAKYEEDLKASGATRGGRRPVSALTQIIDLTIDKEGIDAALKRLKPYQVPFLEPQLLFRGGQGPVPAQISEEICMLVNTGRINGSADMIALAAQKIAASKMASRLVNPKELIEEAAELAVFRRDVGSLNVVVAILESQGPLHDEDLARVYRNELKAIGTSRGVAESDRLKSWLFMPYYYHQDKSPETSAERKGRE